MKMSRGCSGRDLQTRLLVLYEFVRRTEDLVALIGDFVQRMTQMEVPEIPSHSQITSTDLSFTMHTG
jgi:hypothetical protein